MCGDCKQFDVIGGREELRSRRSGWEQFEGHTPHRPWIDQVKILCAKCGGTALRISDVGNPWLDAGIVPFSTMGWSRDKEYWKKWFPADFVVEIFPGQFRNWFYSLLAMSTMLADAAPFKALLGHALVRDQWGRAMHKSDGNAIPFEGVADAGYAVKNIAGVNEQEPPMGRGPGAMAFLAAQPGEQHQLRHRAGGGTAQQIILKVWNTSHFSSIMPGSTASTPQPRRCRPQAVLIWIGGFYRTCNCSSVRPGAISSNSICRRSAWPARALSTTA